MTAIKLNILLDLVHLQPRLLYHYKIKTKHSIRKDKNPVSEVCLKKKKKGSKWRTQHDWKVREDHVCFHRNLDVRDWTDCNRFPPPLSLLSILLFLIWRFTLTFGLLHLAICQPFDRKHILTSDLIPFWSVLHDTSNQRAFDSSGQKGEWKCTPSPTQHCHSPTSWV